MQTIEERAQDFYDSFFDTATMHLMDVAEGINKPNAAELEAYGDHMKNYPQDTALECKFWNYMGGILIILWAVCAFLRQQPPA